MAKNPITKFNPRPEKVVPQKAGVDDNPHRLRPAWRIGSMEMCDPFGWHQIDGATLEYIRSKLACFESMRWGEIFGHQNHLIPTRDLSKEARERLEALRLDELESVMSLRLSGGERVFGILEHNILTLLWWDPKHRVCPYTKK